MVETEQQERQHKNKAGKEKISIKN